MNKIKILDKLKIKWPNKPKELLPIHLQDYIISEKLEVSKHGNSLLKIKEEKRKSS